MFGEELDFYFNTTYGFAVAGTVGTSTVNVVYDRAYVRELSMVSGAEPMALAKAEDTIAAVASTIAISGTSFVIRDREPVDDGALVLLKLEEV